MRATLVKMQFAVSVVIVFGFVWSDVPGATPKKPASGLIAYSRPSSPNFIHAMSSPTVSTFHPAASGSSSPCSSCRRPTGTPPRRSFSPLGRRHAEDEHVLGQPAVVAAIVDAIRRAKHFLPSSALPP